MSKIMIVENPGRDQIFEFLERETGRVSFSIYPRKMMTSQLIRIIV